MSSGKKAGVKSYALGVAKKSEGSPVTLDSLGHAPWVNQHTCSRGLPRNRNPAAVEATPLPVEGALD